MEFDNIYLEESFKNIFSLVNFDAEKLTPSQFAEQNIVLGSEISSVEGKFSYDITPYLKEIADCASPYHPSKVIAFMKGTQIGATQGVILPITLWKIAQNPSNFMSLSATDETSEKYVTTRLDAAIASAGLQHLLKPTTIRNKNQRTGNTNRQKEFPGGNLFLGGLQSINKIAREISIQTALVDEWETAKVSDAKQGNTLSLILKRMSSYSDSMKGIFISSPIEKPSNIEHIFLMGDQRHWYVPCPLCGAYIEIIWHDKKEGERVGVVFDRDKTGRLIESSVGYVCQECSGFFKEKHKYDINLAGNWKPTAEPDREGYFSYYINSLCAAPNMFGWTDYAYEWCDIYKDGRENIGKLKYFTQTALGLPWEERKQDIKKDTITRNVREYDIGTIPVEMSKRDGNDNVILVTCSVDMGGTIDDARLDYEVVAHTINGSSYSIDAGSIGTYKSKGKQDLTRVILSYVNNDTDNVWDYLYNDVINKTYPTDGGGEMKIFCTFIDTGYLEHYAFNFINHYASVKDVDAFNVYGVIGRTLKEKQFRTAEENKKSFFLSTEKNNLWIIYVDMVKDRLVEKLNLQWPVNLMQPPGYMNFPTSDGIKYTTKGFYSHYQAEQKQIEYNANGDEIGHKWVKKSGKENHFFDVAVYNLAAREIVAFLVCKESKIPNGRWADFVDLMRGAR